MEATTAPQHPRRTRQPAHPERSVSVPEPGFRFSLQCVGNSKQSGKRCRRAPIPGGTVCKIHGGGTPTVQKSARAFLAEQVQPSIARLATEREKATKSADRIRASVALLDRAGFGPRVTVEVDDARSLLIERLRDLRARGPEAIEALRAAAAVVVADDDDTIDAEVVEDGDEDDSDDAGDTPDPKRQRRG